MSFFRSILWHGVKHWIRSQFPQVSHISTTELANWFDRPTCKEKPLLLDARTPEEYVTSHLHQAQLVPTQLETLQDWQGVTKTTPIVVYCSVGYRSGVIAKHLQEMGFERVYNLEGSIFAWANEGHSVYQGEKRVQHIHPYNSLWVWLLKSELR